MRHPLGDAETHGVILRNGSSFKCHKQSIRKAAMACPRKRKASIACGTEFTQCKIHPQIGKFTKYGRWLLGANGSSVFRQMTA